MLSKNEFAIKARLEISIYRYQDWMATKAGVVANAAGPAADDDASNTFRDLLRMYVLEPENNRFDHLCMISHEPLVPRHVQLPCGHEFNYDMLYKEVDRQKRRRFNSERPRLGDNQLRCPYCGVVHDGLLPPCRGYPPVSRVNSPIKWSLDAEPCQHLFIRGKNRGELCGGISLCGEKRCKQHAPRPAPE
jgi:hypothetical protein